jgi:hypothetical protein
MPAQCERQDGLLSRTCQQKDRVEHRVSSSSSGPCAKMSRLALKDY